MQTGKLAEAREARGLAILLRGHQISRFNESMYEVTSQSKDGEKYGVLNSSELGMVCSCPDNTFRDGLDYCKHIKALKLRQCGECKSYDTEKRGIRKVKEHFRQELHCKSCESWFSLDLSRHSTSPNTGPGSVHETTSK